MGRLIQFFKDVRVELSKVVWPSRKEAIKLTAIVIAFSLAVAAFLGLIDFGMVKFLALIVKGK